jgi:acetyltransferase-like isoleucine patch superfamily enzyme
MFKENSIKSITVVRMEVPCCGGLISIAKEALIASGKDIPLNEVVIGIRGEVIKESFIPLYSVV